jgi:hypothetical protein
LTEPTSTGPTLLRPTLIGPALIGPALSRPVPARPRVPPGDRLHVRWLRPLAPGDLTPADLYVVGCLCWGELAGDDVSRSNHRSLVRDFPDQFVHLHDAHGARGLALLPSFANRELTGALLRLAADYPLYDDDDHSKLVCELAVEMWPAYLTFEVPAALRAQHCIDPDDLGLGDDELRVLFFRIHAERFGDEYAETADSVVFPSQNRIVAAMATELRGRASTRSTSG